MPDVVLLDAGPLGLVSHPRKNQEAKVWLQRLLRRRARVIVPEIADYEVRRELLLYRKTAGLARLDHLKSTLEYAPVTTKAWLLAAEFWADARARGRPTSSTVALDADMILVAQAVLLGGQDDVVIATTNIAHLERYAQARLWQEIE